MNIHIDINRHQRIRDRFYKGLVAFLHVVWPVLSALLSIIIIFGLLISYIEGWKPLDGIYFGFVTGLTVGYGDLVPHHALARIMALIIGFTGVLLTALFAAIGVRALEEAVKEEEAAAKKE